MAGSLSALFDLTAPALAPRERLIRQGIAQAAAHLGGGRIQAAVHFERLPLYPKQAAIVDDPARFTICEATTKAGKTLSHLEWLLDEGIRANEGHWWWVATVSDVADIAFRRAINRLQGLVDTAGTIKRVSEAIAFEQNKTRKYIAIGGAMFWFKSADEPDSLFGEDVRAVVGDEITRWKEEAWTALYTTLTATKGRAKLIGNVKGRRNFAYRLARKAEAGAPGWGYHRLTAADAIEGGVIDAAVVEQARRDLPPEVFGELYEAEASDDQGNPFGLTAIKGCLIPKLAEGPVVAWGWDLAKSVDWTVGVGLNRDGHVCELLRFQESWGATEARIRKVTKAQALVDSTGVGDPVFERLASGSPHFRSFKFSATSKQQIMEGLAVSIQRKEVGFPDGVLRRELDAFEFEYTRTGVRYSAPPGMHDDCVCALALANHLLRRRGLVVAPGGTQAESAYGRF